MAVYDLTSSYSSVAEGFVNEARKTLAGAMARIEHCVGQLDESDVWWRPHEPMNAVGNIVLHLCGNLRQWVVAALTGTPAERDREAEFAHRDPVPKVELLTRLRAVVAECDRLIASARSDAALLQRRRVQGFDTTVLAAVFHAVSHFEGHAQEVVYVTRLRRGGAYRLLWQPVTREQGAATPAS